MKTDILGRITETLLDFRKKKQIELVIVGLEGKGCSGKTRLAADLRDCLVSRGAYAQIASIDDFCNPRAVRRSPAFDIGLQVYHCNFDEDLWVAEILHPAKQHGRLTFDRVLLDPVTDLYNHSVSVNLPHGGFLITEGIHVLKRRFEPYYHYKIFVHISDEEQLRRALRRDVMERGYTASQVEGKYRNRMLPSYEHFLAEDRPSADFVLDNCDPDHPTEMSTQEAELAMGHVSK